MNYRPDIDGLRAVAVLAVVFFHADLGFSGGFVGVDIFFVISGFLITSIVTRQLEDNSFTFAGFWERRIRRIFPAMIVMVLTTILLGLILLLPNETKELGQSTVAQAFAAANLYFYRESGYFATESEIQPLLHTWSLAVEEQFYFLMPLFLYVLHYKFRRKIVSAFLTVFLVSLSWCVYSTETHPDAAFYLLPARAWEMTLGALAGFRSRILTGRRIAGELASLLGFATIILTICLYHRRLAFPGYFALLPCVGTAAVIVGNVDRNTFVFGLLSSSIAVRIGLLSYSLYLWHWPIFAFSNYFTPNGRTVSATTASAH